MKNRKHSTLKAAAVLFLFFALSLFSSCKVTIDGDTEYTVYGTVQGKYDDRTQPIPGIVVEIIENGGSYKSLTYTDSHGWFEFRDVKEGDYTLRFTDTDGAENGSFKQWKERLPLARRDYNFGMITLESAN
ncbi:carboxypeptidase regulatory-like domain-containing protein [Treponema ruminis]|uniref:Putative lipoprotein (RSAM/lipoprotein system) n=1 Tax=Treponema ruminis TaxID=744515 RepID=A0A7W8LMX2_9SPIR|nr:carboxypeptidase-like regulatory domain-containing protein [Treponema ruminis]MBB5226922.1 putative lipoprotein (rSAM/lipoprotein system) [Treponema ruminis]QSI01349.1 carboxypeptidase regulatory-like domain-containing protein [Treponema ruminis]